MIFYMDDRHAIMVVKDERDVNQYMAAILIMDLLLSKMQWIGKR